MQPGFEVLEHTADVGIRAWGASIGEAFEQAGWALADILGARTAGPGSSRTIEATGSDEGSVLVDFLNELLLAHETEDAGFAAIRVHAVSDASADAEIDLAPLPTTREGVPVKAATLHGLGVEHADDGHVEVRVYLDV
jgi:SHS2 domain-containing protein